jgi:hypothetical protein
MRSCCWLIAFVYVTSFLQEGATAQESQRETDMPPGTADSLRRVNTAGILFDRNLNTFNWIGRLAVDTTVAGTRTAISAQYLANIIQLDGVPPGGIRFSESSQQQINLLLGRPLSTTTEALARWSSLVYSDNKGIGLSNASNLSMLAGLNLMQLPLVTITPLAGYRWDRQGDIRDQGVSVDLGMDLHGLDIDGYRMGGSARLRKDFVDPRTLENHLAGLGIEKPFGPFSRDSLALGFLRTRREFYTQGDSAIESRIDRFFSLANVLEYELNRNMMAGVFIQIGSRALDKDNRRIAGAQVVPQFDTEIEEFRLDTHIKGEYRSDDSRTVGMVRFAYMERSESHRAKKPAIMPPNIAVLFEARDRQEQSKDNLTRNVVLAGTFSLPLSPSDRFSIAGSGSILRYDTPSEQNREDRDELLVALTLGTASRVSRYLDLGITLDGTLGHLVYLLKERSANNRVNRILRLYPRTTFRPVSWFTTVNAFEVLANYTVYDFEQALAQVRSFSYRQFAWVDSTQLEFTRRIGLDFFAYLKLYERGLLKWEDFSERTENAFVDQTLACQLRFTPVTGTVLGVGVRYFSQARYLFRNGVRQEDAFSSSVGPTCAIAWEIGPHSRMDFRGWYERRKYADGAERSLASMTMQLIVHF